MRETSPYLDVHSLGCLAYIQTEYSLVLTGETVLGGNPHVIVVPGRAAKFVGFRIN